MEPITKGTPDYRAGEVGNIPTIKRDFTKGLPKNVNKTPLSKNVSAQLNEVFTKLSLEQISGILLLPNDKKYAVLKEIRDHIAQTAMQKLNEEHNKTK